MVLHQDMSAGSLCKAVREARHEYDYGLHRRSTVTIYDEICGIQCVSIPLQS